MITDVILWLNFVGTSAVLVYVVRVEHRLTKLETMVTVLEKYWHNT